jgi:hypothetical protein
VLLDLGLIAVRGTQTQLATCHDIVDMIPVPASSAGQIGRRPDGAERQALLKRLSEISESRRQGIGDPSRLLGEWKAVFEQLKKPQSPKKNDQSS